MGSLIIMHAQLEIGFWFFTDYYLFAIASNILMTKPQLTAN